MQILQAVQSNFVQCKQWNPCSSHFYSLSTLSCNVHPADESFH